MDSAFGVDHGDVSKAFWNKKPVRYESEPPEGDINRVSAYKGKKNVGFLETKPYHDEGRAISYVKVRPLHRRQGIASGMLAEARKAGPVSHTSALTKKGKKFAEATP